MPSLLRTWLIRGLLMAVLAAAGVGVWWASIWVSPEKIRTAVQAHLHDKFGDGVEVSVGSAYVRLFGGLSVSDLTLTRAGESQPFLTVPHAVLYHDKEALNRGALLLNKLELTGPTLRLERAADGTWNLPKLAPASGKDADKPLPTILVTDATVLYTDRGPDAPPPLAATHVKLTLLNDPLPVLRIDAQGTVLLADALENGKPRPGALALPFTLLGRLNRGTGQYTLRLEPGEIDFGPDLAPALARIHPKAGELAQKFTGKATVTADLASTGDPARPLKYDVRVSVRDGRYEDAMLPWPIDRLAGTVRLADGKLTVDGLSGRLGNSTAELSLESKPDLLAPPAPVVEVPGRIAPGPRWPPVRIAHRLATPAPAPIDFGGDDPLAVLESRVERYELKVNKLSLDDDLFARLTPQAARLRRQFSPEGAVDVAVSFARPNGGWRREVDVRPNGLSMEYEWFKYRIRDLGGSLKKVVASDGTDEFQVGLIGTGGGRRIELSGRVAASATGPDSLIDLKVTGRDVPVDAKLIDALPPPYPAALARLRANARGHFEVTIRRDMDVNRTDTAFRVKVYNGSICHTAFPLPLDHIRGDLTVTAAYSDPSRPVRPGPPKPGDADTARVELRNFEGVYNGGRLWLTGQSAPVPGTPDHLLTARVSGDGVPLDDRLKAALAEAKLDAAVKQLSPRGEITFGANLEVRDHAAVAGKPPRADRLPAVVAAHQPGAILPVAALLPASAAFAPTTDVKLTLNFRGPSITPAAFPYDLHQLAGIVVYDAGKLNLIKCSARHGTTDLRVEAAEVRLSAGGGVWANAGGIAVGPLAPDNSLLKSLPAEARTAVEKLNVRGSVDVQLDHLVVRVPGANGLRPAAGADKPGDVIQARGQAPAEAWRSTDRPEKKSGNVAGLFPLPWQKPPAPPPVVAVPPPADPNAASVYWNGRVKFAGGSLDAGVPVEDVFGSVSSEGSLEGDRVGVVVGNLWLDRATVARQPVAACKLSYCVRPPKPDPAKPGTLLPTAVEVRDLSANLFGGTVGGEARLTLSDPARYRVWLTAADVRLEDVARHYKLGSGELSGKAQAEAVFESVTDPKTGRTTSVGHGQVDVPHGRMYNLPVLLELVKVLKGQTPDGVAFEEAHATFDMAAGKVKVTQLDLLGAAVSLGGSGEVDLASKDLKFDFYPIWSQSLKRLLTNPLGDPAGAVSSGLFKIELTRVDGKQSLKAHVLPAVTDPVRAVAERMRNRLGGRDGGGEPAVRAAPQR